MGPVGQTPQNMSRRKFLDLLRWLSRSGTDKCRAPKMFVCVEQPMRLTVELADRPFSAELGEPCRQQTTQVTVGGLMDHPRRSHERHVWSTPRLQ